MVAKVPLMIWHLSVSHRIDRYSVYAANLEYTVLRCFNRLWNMTDNEKWLDKSFLKLKSAEFSGAIQIMIATGGEVICNFLCLSIL